MHACVYACAQYSSVGPVHTYTFICTIHIYTVCMYVIALSLYIHTYVHLSYLTLVTCVIGSSPVLVGRQQTLPILCVEEHLQVRGLGGGVGGGSVYVSMCVLVRNVFCVG